MCDLSHYIKLRSGLSGCDPKLFECDKYLDCDRCLEDKIKEHDKQIKAEVIDDFTIKLENAIQEDIDDDVINQWDKGTFMGCVKFVAEQLKENK